MLPQLSPISSQASLPLLALEVIWLSKSGLFPSMQSPSSGISSVMRCYLLRTADPVALPEQGCSHCCSFLFFL